MALVEARRTKCLPGNLRPSSSAPAPLYHTSPQRSQKLLNYRRASSENLLLIEDGKSSPSKSNAIEGRYGPVRAPLMLQDRRGLSQKTLSEPDMKSTLSAPANLLNYMPEGWSEEEAMRRALSVSLQEANSQQKTLDSDPFENATESAYYETNPFGNTDEETSTDSESSSPASEYIETSSGDDLSSFDERVQAPLPSNNVQAPLLPFLQTNYKRHPDKNTQSLNHGDKDGDALENPFGTD